MSLLIDLLQNELRGAFGEALTWPDGWETEYLEELADYDEDVYIPDMSTGPAYIGDDEPDYDYDDEEEAFAHLEWESGRVEEFTAAYQEDEPLICGKPLSWWESDEGLAQVDDQMKAVLQVVKGECLE